MMHTPTYRAAVKPRLRRWMGHGPNPRKRRSLFFDPLEDRTLLAATALLDINNTAGSPTKGLLTYTGSAAVTDGLTVKTSTVITDGADGFSTLMYTFTSDANETITLGPGAIADGWTGSGTTAVTGPGSIKMSTTTSYVSSVSITLQSGNDTATISSVGASTSLIFNNKPGNADAVTLGGSGGAQGISGNLSITNTAGTTALTVNDSGDTSPRTVFVSGTQIANLEPSLILFGAANLSSLTITGGNALGTLNVNANDQGPVSVTGGSATGSGTIAIGSNAPIHYSNFLAVNVSNEADQPLTQVSQTVTTSTGATPTTGTAFTYATTTFADDDSQAKPANFVATIDWGDGTTPTAGTITADGVGQFQVNGTHTYAQAGSYSVVTTITDLGTTDTYSISGIAVTISDVGGGGLTTGSVAQVNLVSNNSSISAEGTDSHLVNPWGITAGELGLAWVADEESGVVTSYASPNGTTPQEPPVVIPPASGKGTGSPTGIVSNTTSRFAIKGQPSAFLFATLDGTISGWNGQFPGSGSPTAVIALNHATSDAVYTGLAIADDGNQELLYVANFHSGQIEVYNGQFQPVSTSNDPDWTLLTNTFTDPNLPAGFAPYNVQNIGGNLYVTFAKPGATAGTALAQLGDGFVDEFTPDGTLIQQLIKGSPLDAPWGLALAPSDFGPYGGDLIVANTGNGQIDAFDPTTGQFLGALADNTGAVLVNDGLHGLLFTASTGEFLEFTAAPDGGTSGLIGSLSATSESVTVIPAPVTATITNITGFATQPFNGVVATFTDTNTPLVAGDFTATVDWGDGSSNTSSDGTGTVTITKTNATGTTYLVTGIHTYFTPTTGQPPDILSVTITQNGTSNTVTVQGTATISNPTLHVTLSGITAIVDEPYAGAVATFTDDAPDSNLGDYSATINWGDGTPTNPDVTSGRISLANQAGQGYVVTDAGGHLYTSATTGQAPYVVTVTITKTATDSQGNPLDESGEAEGNVAVANPALHATLSSITAIVGVPYAGVVATFTDDAPDPNLNDYAATINWGDGTTTIGAIALANQSGQQYIITDSGGHVYTGATTGQAPYVVTVTIIKTATDTQGNPLVEAATVAGNVVVSDPTLHVTLSSITAIVGVPYAGAVATFTDDAPDPNLNDYAATINWGDGTTTIGAIALANQSGQQYIVTDAGGHLYTSATTGQAPYVVTVTINKTANDTQGNPLVEAATVAGNVAVSDPTLHATLSSITAIVGVPYAGTVATFTDDAPDPTIGDYAATISWGDGTFSAGTIALANQSGQGFIVTDAGAHVYTTATTGQSPFVVTVTITKTATATQGTPLIETATVAGNVAVSDPTLHATLSSITAIVGVPYAGVVATFTDDAPDPILGDYAATIGWGDGTFSAGTIALANQSGQGFIVTDAGAHVYTTATTGQSPFVVTVTIAKTATATQGAPLLETATVAGNVAVSDPTLHATLSSITAIVGVPYAGTVATFTDDAPDPILGDYAATISWGDGTFSAGTIALANQSGQGFIVTDAGAHVYTTATTGQSPFVVTVNITKTGTATQGAPLLESAMVAGNVAVSDPTLHATLSSITAIVGVPYAGVVATFTDDAPDPILGDYAATISWGDGTFSAGTIALANQSGQGFIVTDAGGTFMPPRRPASRPMSSRLPSPSSLLPPRAHPCSNRRWWLATSRSPIPRCTRHSAGSRRSWA